MAIDERVAGQVRAALADAASVREVKMFGGLGFMLNGHMVAASSDRGLLVRVGELGAATAGCIAIARDALLALLPLLGPASTITIRA